MTEDEAKTKWCPYARFVIDSPTTPSGNRWDQGDGGATGSYAERACRCIGSACMAWRWNYERVPCGDGYSRNLPSDTKGHCGLAGRP